MEDFDRITKSDCHKSDDEDWVAPFATDWFNNIKEEITAGDNLRFYRKLNHLSQLELAGRIGTSKQAISQMENGKRTISASTARKLASVLGTSVSRFIF